MSESRKPVITLLLLLANIAAAFYVLLNPQAIDEYGFNSVSPSLVTIFSSMFIHANVLHLLGNMIFLAAVGVAVEIATGSGRFFLVYFLSGLLGVAMFWLSTRQVIDGPPLVGASGCIAGCATYYSLRYTKVRVPLAPKASSSVAVVTLTWLALQVVGALVRVGEPMHASGFFAHLGGAIGGGLLGVLFKAPDLGSKRFGHKVYEALNEDHGPAARANFLQEHLKAHPDDLKMKVQLADHYREMGEKTSEASTLLEVVFQLEGKDLEESVQRLIDLKWLTKISAVRRRQLADKLPLPLAVKVLSSIVEEGKKDAQTPEALLQLIGLLRESNDGRASKLLEMLIKDFPSHGAVETARQRGWLS